MTDCKHPLRILAINCGSTSTKLAFYENECEIFSRSVSLMRDVLEKCKTLQDAVSFREESVETFLSEQGIAIEELDCIVARGGVPCPLESGAYVIDEALLEALKHNGEKNGAIHHGNISGILAHRMAQEAGIPAYIYDAVSVDELAPVARYSGIKDAPRYSRTHTLNTRAMAMEASRERGGDFSSMNIITAHLGGGNSVNIYAHGKLIDLVTGEEGGFSAERCGGIPGELILDLLRTQGFDAVNSYFHGRGGLVSYCGTNSAEEVEKRAQSGDTEAAAVLDALAYQTAKCIASMAAVVSGKVDLIVLTGGMLHSDRIASSIRSRVEFLAPVIVKPGEREMWALAQGAARVMRGEEIAKRLVPVNE